MGVSVSEMAGCGPTDGKDKMPFYARDEAELSPIVVDRWLTTVEDRGGSWVKVSGRDPPTVQHHNTIFMYVHGTHRW